jgi:Polyketide cyclase / dehydrase and lipid transport
MGKIITIIIVVLIAGVLIFAATKPNTFRVQRSVIINAQPKRIFAFINDFHKWDVWSPYEKLDPAMKRTYSGSKSGKGSIYEWKGNMKAGQGRMEIVNAIQPSVVTIKLDFMKPMAGHNTSEFTLEPKWDSTKVTWTMYGPYSYFHKIMSVFFNMDKMIGNAFETGLNNLKTIVEK